MNEITNLVKNKKIKRSELPVVYKMAVRNWALKNNFEYNKHKLSVTIPSDVFLPSEFEDEMIVLFINIWVSRDDKIYLKLSNTKHNLFINLGYLLNIEHALSQLTNSNKESL